MSLSLTEDHRERFQRYTSRVLIKFDNKNYDYDSGAQDDEIKRPRLLLFTCDQDQEEECKFQKYIRKAKSKIISLTVHGFKHNGVMPDILQTAQIECPSLGIRGVYVIVAISLSSNHKQRKVLKLKLADPGSFNRRIKSENQKGGWSK